MNEARVEEQSHKSEMRAALRGDFERLRARRQTETNGEAELTESFPETVVALAPEGPTPTPVATQLSWRERLRGLR